MKKTKSILRYLAIGVLSLILILVFLFTLENPYLSNYLKKLILPELQSATGYPATAEKIYLHIFPLYAGVKDLKFIDDKGEVTVRMGLIKVYPELSSFIFGRPTIRRVLIKEPSFLMNKDRIEFIKENIKDYLSKGVGGRKLKISFIDLSKGEFLWQSSNKGHEYHIKGIRLNVKVKEDMEIISSAEEILIPEFKRSLRYRTHLTIPLKAASLDRIDIKYLDILSGGSDLNISGSFSLKERSQLKIGLNLLMKDIISGLSLNAAPGDRGLVKARGSMNVNPWSESGLSGLLKGITLEIKTWGDLRLENLMDALAVREKLSGSLRFALSISGDPLTPLIEGDARLISGNLFNIEVDDLRTEVSFRDHIFTFSNVRAELYGGMALAEAEIPVPVHDFRLYVKAKGVRDKAVLGLIGLKLDIPDGFVDGELTHKGKRFSPVGWFVYKSTDSVSVRKGLNPFVTLKEIKGDFIYDGEERAITFSSLSADSELLSVSMRGSYRLEDKYIDGHYDARLEPDGLNKRFGSFFKFKSGRLTGEVKGNLPEPVIKGNINLISPSIKDYDLEHITGSFFYTASIFEPFLKGSSRGEEHSLSGSVRFDSHEVFDFSAPKFALKAQFKNLRLKPLLPDPRIIAEKEPTIDGEVAFKGDNLYEEFNLRFKKATSSLNGVLNLTRWKEYNYKFYSMVYLKDLELIDPQILESRIHIMATGNGTLPDINGFLNINSDMVTFNTVPVGAIKLDGVIEKGSFAVAGTLLDGLAVLKGKGNLKAPIDYALEIKMKDGSYKPLIQALIKDAPEDIDFGLNGNIRIHGEGSIVSGDLNLEKFLIAGYGHRLNNREPVHITIDRNIITLKSLRMVNEAGEVSLAGRVYVGDRYDLEFKGSSYLWPFKRFSRSINTLRGKVDFNISLSGKWESPQLSGALSLQDGTIGIEDMPYHVTGVNSSIRFNGNRVDIESLRGRVAWGIIDARGVVYLRGFRLGRFNIEVNLQNISATISEDFTISFDSTLYLKGERELQFITGDVRLKKAFYRKYIEWRSWMLKGTELQTPEVTIPSYLDAKLNVRITGPLSEASSAVMIDNNIASAALKVNLLLKGTLRRPVILGRIETLSGVVYFRNNELKLLSATLDFSDPQRIDPYFRIRAETFSRGYRINLLAEGHLRRFNLSLSSEPPLDEVDIIALLAVGETGTALKGYGGGIGAAEASSFITGQFQETLEQRARHYTGIDRVQISPYVSKTGEIGPRVTVGKKIGERLSILYSSAVGSKESDVIKVEYELSKKVLLVGEKDERGSMGGDIKFRFQFR
ncbi:MAG: translocation/assembly module TamB domain-containing protein [Thermodesulfovibrionales bacterium]